MTRLEARRREPNLLHSIEVFWHPGLSTVVVDVLVVSDLVAVWMDKEKVSFSIEIAERPTEEHRQAIVRGLIDFNRTATGVENYAPFAILIRSELQELTGGLWGRFAYDWLFIELVFVPEQLRRSGLGARLMRTAEATALSKDCVGVWLDTHSFQAPKFYEKLGYEEFGRLPAYPGEHERIFLRKLFR